MELRKHYLSGERRQVALSGRYGGGATLFSIYAMFEGWPDLNVSGLFAK